MAPSERTSKRQKLSPPEIPPPVNPSESATITDGTQRKNELSANDTATRASWYSRTWPRKVAPVTQLDRESISSTSSAAADSSPIVKDRVRYASDTSRKSSLALTLGKSAPRKALPLTATTTTDHAMPESRCTPRKETHNTLSLTRSKPPRIPVIEPLEQRISDPATTAQPAKDVANGTPEEVTEIDPAKQTDTGREIIAPRSWIGWLARTEDTLVNSASSIKDGQEQQEGNTPAIPAQDNKGKASESAPAPSSGERPPEQSSKPSPEPQLDQPPPVNQRRSWLPIWNNAIAAQSAPVITSPSKDIDSKPTSDAHLKIGAPVKPNDRPSDEAVTAPKGSAEGDAESQPAAKPSAWVFWSRETPGETTSLKDVPIEGGIATANTETGIPPRRASLSTGTNSKQGIAIPKEDPPILQTPKDVQLATDNKSSKKIHGSKSSKDSTKSEPKSHVAATKVQSKGATATAVAPTDVGTSRPSSPAPAKRTYDHLLLPAFHATLKLPESPTLLQHLTRLLYAPREAESKHLNLIKDVPKLKNALAIGVHGYFPAPLIRSVLGQPTGTSIKFADMAAKSIQRWTKKRGYECHVKTAALEGEGKIADRIDLLWRLLLNWIDEIRKADFLMIACHSQGVPVAIMLVAKLIHFGCINAGRVGICAMAGVNMGPFLEFKSRWMSGSAGELFEFADPSSKVSTDYLAALDDVLKFGVKVTYIGSIDDQLVSLESSILAPVSHPHIYRAVSINSPMHALDFASHLVAFALKLRNLGVEDHGLVRELSGPLAGSVYTGEGHSRLYEDDAIYDLAVRFALETSSIPGVPLSRKSAMASGVNPFILPFAMRGMLEEDFVKSDLQKETSLLLQRFDDWKPVTKALKDVKFRLEGIRSKL